MLAAVAQDGLALHYASASLQEDQEVVHALLLASGLRKWISDGNLLSGYVL